MFNIEIYTPAGKILTETVSSVKLPAGDGQIQVLENHTGYVGLLGVGILEYVTTQGNTKRLVVSGGFVSHMNETLSILSDEAILPDKVDPKYSDERTNLQTSLKSASLLDPSAQRARKKLELISAIDALVTN